LPSASAFSKNTRNGVMLLEKDQSQNMMQFNKNFQYYFSDLFSDSNHQNYLHKIIHPKIITFFIATQLEKFFLLKSPLFFFNLKTGMLKLIKRIIKDYNSHICGIKISCSGK
jgi:hypothetical protein